MIISAKGRYALRVMVELAKNGTGFTSLKDIAEREAIPHKFLENTMTELVKANLAESVRGKNGGYRLTRPPEDYTVADILSVTEKTSAADGCTESDFVYTGCSEMSGEGCSRARSCPTLPMWKALDETLNAFFKQYTLKSLLPK